MNWYQKLLMKLVKRPLLKILSNDKFKQKLANYVDEKVDIPNVSEDTERQLFVATIMAISEYLDVVLKGK